MVEQNFQNTYIVAEGGKYVMKEELVSSQAAPGHILVKVAYTTCNPYDAYFYSSVL